jgi:glutathione S-transferase
MASRALELYWISGSPYSWRALLALEVKKILYASRLVQASKGELTYPAFLSLNPRGKVPVLRDGEFVVYESIAILQYLEAKFPSVPLFGRSAGRTAIIWRGVSECSAYFEEPVMQISRPLTFGQSEQKAEEIREALPKIHAELDRMETGLKDSAWLCGDEFTATDFTVFPFLKLLLRVSAKPEAASFSLGLLPLEHSYPRLAQWIERIEQLPGYERTYPPHWKQ